MPSGFNHRAFNHRAVNYRAVNYRAVNYRAVNSCAPPVLSVDWDSFPQTL
jgi:hypothetical protein